jgi:hypothetical protein
MMIRRGQFKYITCPADPDQLFNLVADPHELTNLADPKQLAALPEDVRSRVEGYLAAFRDEAQKKWNFSQITEDVHKSQRQRQLVWHALKQGTFTSWDYNPNDDGREKYIRSHMPLDDLELRARYPQVDDSGREYKDKSVVHYGQAGAHNV